MTGGTQVLSDWLKVRITAAPGSTFVDRMIALIEGAERQKTPNEIALSILLSGLTLIFLIAVVTLWGLAGYSGTVLTVTVLAALLVTLIPTTIGGLLSAIGIAGMDRLVRFNVIATSGRAVEAAGDVDTLLLDKTGTITFGNRMATEFLPVRASPRPSWPRQRCWPALATRRRRAAPSSRLPPASSAASSPSIKRTTVVPFAAETRLSGVDIGGRRIRKGAVDAALKFAGIDSTRRAGGVPPGGRQDRPHRRHAAGGRRRRQRCSASST